MNPTNAGASADTRLERAATLQMICRKEAIEHQKTEAHQASQCPASAEQGPFFETIFPEVLQAAFFGSSQSRCRAKALCTHVSSMGRLYLAGALSEGVVTVRPTIVARPRVVCVF
jgi:hypothetical protein